MSLAALAGDLGRRGATLTLRRGYAVQEILSIGRETGAEAVFAGRATEPWARRSEASLADALNAEGVAFNRSRTVTLFDPDTLRAQAKRPFRRILTLCPRVLRSRRTGPASPRPRTLPRWGIPAFGCAHGLGPAAPQAGLGRRSASDLDSRRSRSAFPAQAVPKPRARKLRSNAQRAGRRRQLDAVPAPALGRALPAPGLARRVAGGARDREGAGDLPPRAALARILPLSSLVPSGAARSSAAPGICAHDLQGGWRGTQGMGAGNDGHPDRGRGNAPALANRVDAQPGADGGRKLPHQTPANSVAGGRAVVWDTLVDADLGSNSASWQWVAGCGADASPYFRVFNPVLQGRKFDPDGSYVRRWVPELAALDGRFIHAPWEAPVPALDRAAIRLGETYPEPVIDLGQGRVRALQAYRALARPAE